MTIRAVLRFRSLGAAALLCAAATANAATNWPQVEDPPRAKVEWVAQDLRVNGLPSRIERFESELSPDEVLGFYRDRWKRDSAVAPREASGGGWRTLSTLRKPFQLVLQVKPRSPQGSEGMISIADFSDVQRDWVPAGWPRWRDTHVLQVTEAIDGPKHSRQVSMVSSESFDVNLNRWREEWRRRGFTLTRERTEPRERGERSWFGLFDKGSQTLEMTLVYRDADRRSYLSANQVGPAGEDLR